MNTTSSPTQPSPTPFKLRVWDLPTRTFHWLLVLLVMLILTIPPQWHAVNMGLPVSAKPPDIKPQVIVLDILPGDGLRWNGQTVTGATELADRMKQAATLQPAPVLHIRPHRQAPYAAVAQALSTAQRQGLQQLALLDGFE